MPAPGARCIACARRNISQGGKKMPDIMKFIVNEHAVKTDPNGYLLDLDDWSEEVAEAIAESDDISLTDGHWEIINYLREHYLKFGHSPNVRLLMKVIQKDLGPEKGTKQYLYDLFPLGPSRQGCKIAGLPLPNDCIDLS